MSGSSPASSTSSSSYPSLTDSDNDPDDARDVVDFGLDGHRDTVGEGFAASQSPPSRFLPAVFIHAGAGFHSRQNEKIHLAACSEAASMGIKFLRAGGTAVEAVEAALRTLEDKEVTNAGYGSNLSIDGTVECDATIVDHLGRSGACGAVPNIRNPISLAKLILDQSNVPLTLRRVPPNILVGQGARSFAKEHGMQTFTNDALVSKNARDRYKRWQEELRRADAKVLAGLRPKLAEKTAVEEASASIPIVSVAMTPVPLTSSASEGSGHGPGSKQQHDHLNAIMTATWNEGQPDSPYGEPSPKRAKQARGPDTAASSSSPSLPYSLGREEYDHDNHECGGDGYVSCRTSLEDGCIASTSGGAPVGLAGIAEDDDGEPNELLESLGLRGTKRSFEPDMIHHPQAKDEDEINDTIGAIAVDANGCIAAASSSGGIGMKHRGRIGPAALVGIGTAVIPCASATADHPCAGPDAGISVAAVTSGTGEHMATTMASRRCAERIFSNTRLGADGYDMVELNEDTILRSFVEDDFMGHPGVRSCHSAGAIGVMTVKRTPTGIYLYFAHNTDSFALASIGGDEGRPLCVMSRLPQGAKIAQGARRVPT